MLFFFPFHDFILFLFKRAFSFYLFFIHSISHVKPNHSSRVGYIYFNLSVLLVGNYRSLVLFLNYLCFYFLQWYEFNQFAGIALLYIFLCLIVTYLALAKLFGPYLPFVWFC